MSSFRRGRYSCWQLCCQTLRAFVSLTSSFQNQSFSTLARWIGAHSVMSSSFSLSTRSISCDQFCAPGLTWKCSHCSSDKPLPGRASCIGASDPLVGLADHAAQRFLGLLQAGARLLGHQVVEDDAVVLVVGHDADCHARNERTWSFRRLTLS